MEGVDWDSPLEWMESQTDEEGTKTEIFGWMGGGMDVRNVFRVVYSGGGRYVNGNWVYIVGEREIWFGEGSMVAWGGGRGTMLDGIPRA